MADAKGTRAGGNDPGADLERRVGRLEFAEGALSRLRVPLRIAAERGRDILTDLDVLAIDIDGRLRSSLSVLECKTTKGQAGEPDRLLWLSGLQRLTRTRRAVLVRQTVTRRGRIIAQALDLQIMDMETLAAREASHAWVPARFAHIHGAGCEQAERRTETQLKGLSHIPAGLVGFLRADSLLADSSECLNALVALNSATAQGIVPNPTALVLAGHALITLLLAAIRDASRLDVVPAADLRERVSRSVTIGDPDNSQILSVLSQADELVQHQVRRIHDAYRAVGAIQQEIAVTSLKAIVAEPPAWLDHYIDLVTRLRANPAIARDLVQTAELACFDALCGDTAYAEPAFDHLFTPEHRYLLIASAKVLREITGDQLADAIGEIGNMNFRRAAPAVPDRAAIQTDRSIPSLAREARPTE
ncbi:hypothetical protein ACPCHT_32205 [Nucisporomicrobium flavum]|uniref:hypothetical protein n=1 Tax=Nucisporomicrobium flavum TaxID=2785915 RepID=UPI003C2DD56D